MKIIGTNWAGPRQLAVRWRWFKLPTLEHGRWHFYVDKYNCVIMLWEWDASPQSPSSRGDHDLL
jgi:hypothetical protein